MTTCDVIRERLQEQMDGTLDPVIARDVDRHLASCAACRGFAADLTAIVDAAASLQPIEAPDHVWLQLAGRWRRENPGAIASARAVSVAPRGFRARHALAAAALLAVAAGGSWIAWRGTASDPTLLLSAPTAAESASNAAAAPLVESARSDIEMAEQLYARAIAGLEQEAAKHKDALEPEVAAMLDKNLEVLDEAIKESRTAMKAQPQSVIARESLFEAMRKKAALLQSTISLVSEISRGNSKALKIED